MFSKSFYFRGLVFCFDSVYPVNLLYIILILSIIVLFIIINGQTAFGLQNDETRFINI